MAFNKVKTYSDLVMFPHTLFSLPFAAVSMLWAAHGLPRLSIIIWILVAFIGARTGANALNRYIDRKIDSKNPRTAGRHLSRGIVKGYEVIILSAVSFGLMVLAAYMLNPLCLELLPLALAAFIFYSYTKRFTWLCHLVLGAACGGAPVGAWIAVTGKIGWPSIVLGAVVTLWVSGFDIIYGSQDYDFDRSEGLFSIPVKFGVKNALIISTVFHVLAVLLLLYLYWLMHLGVLYLTGVALVAILLFIEHRIVSPANLSNVKIASYNINEVVSVVLFIFSAADILLVR